MERLALAEEAEESVGRQDTKTLFRITIYSYERFINNDVGLAAKDKEGRKEGRKEGTYLFDQTTIQYIFMKMQWSGDCR